MQHLLLLLLVLSEAGSIAFFLLSDQQANMSTLDWRIVLGAPLFGYVGHIVFILALFGLKKVGAGIPTTIGYFFLVLMATAAMNFLAMDARFHVFPRISAEIRNPWYVACLLGAFVLVGLAKTVVTR